MALSIGKSVDELLCNVVPMQASHILLGRPWQFDKGASSSELTNSYSFQRKDK